MKRKHIQKDTRDGAWAWDHRSTSFSSSSTDDMTDAEPMLTVDRGSFPKKDSVERLFCLAWKVSLKLSLHGNVSHVSFFFGPFPGDGTALSQTVIPPVAASSGGRLDPHVPTWAPACCCAVIPALFVELIANPGRSS